MEKLTEEQEESRDPRMGVSEVTNNFIDSDLTGE